MSLLSLQRQVWGGALGRPRKSLPPQKAPADLYDKVTLTLWGFQSASALELQTTGPLGWGWGHPEMVGLHLSCWRKVSRKKKNKNGLKMQERTRDSSADSWEQPSWSDSKGCLLVGLASLQKVQGTPKETGTCGRVSETQFPFDWACYISMFIFFSWKQNK